MSGVVEPDGEDLPRTGRRVAEFLERDFGQGLPRRAFECAADGVANLDEILATGPDGIFVGPYDLSLSLGMTLEELTGEGPYGILADIARRCLAAGVVQGIYTESSICPKRWSRSVSDSCPSPRTPACWRLPPAMPFPDPNGWDCRQP